MLVLDELPALAVAAPELPSVLQRHVDRQAQKDDASGVHLLVAGSSQRMMEGLVLHRSAPLFGRATEILKIMPLAAGWIREALGISDPVAAVEAYATWGGVPRYWELAADHSTREEALRHLVLSPLGVLHEEPSRLLLDDLRDTSQAASILSLIGQGCHRSSEIAARLDKPATSISRPLQRLLELGLIRREIPFGTSLRSTKKTLYRISDPFLRFWFRFVGPERSRLEIGRIDAVERRIAERFSHHVGEIWEDLARTSAPRLDLFGKSWGPASRWWGPGLDHRPMEIDLIAESDDADSLLLGEVKWTAAQDPERLIAELERKARNLPFAKGRKVETALWLMNPGKGNDAGRIVAPQQALDVLS